MRLVLAVVNPTIVWRLLPRDSVLLVHIPDDFAGFGYGYNYSAVGKRPVEVALMIDMMLGAAGTM